MAADRTRFGGGLAAARLRLRRHRLRLLLHLRLRRWLGRNRSNDLALGAYLPAFGLYCDWPSLE